MSIIDSKAYCLIPEKYKNIVVIGENVEFTHYFGEKESPDIIYLYDLTDKEYKIKDAIKHLFKIKQTPEIKIENNTVEITMKFTANGKEANTVNNEKNTILNHTYFYTIYKKA